jgi:hypothetical protein
MRHAWFPEGDNVIVHDQGRVRHFRRHITCQRCGTVRTEEFRVSYGKNNKVVAVTLVRRHYGYAEGYQVKGGLNVDDARAMLFENLSFVREGD